MNRFLGEKRSAFQSLLQGLPPAPKKGDRVDLDAAFGRLLDYPPDVREKAQAAIALSAVVLDEAEKLLDPQHAERARSLYMLLCELAAAIGRGATPQGR